MTWTPLPQIVWRVTDWINNVTYPHAEDVEAWQGWIGTLRDRLDGLGRHVDDVEARQVTAGSGLDGGGDGTTDRTLSVEWGTGHEQVPRGDEVVRANAALTADQIVIGSDGGKVVTTLGAGADQQVLTMDPVSKRPAWMAPSSSGGLPQQSAPGVLMATRDGGVWDALAAPTASGQILMSDLSVGQDMAWKGMPWTPLTLNSGWAYDALAPRCRVIGDLLYLDGVIYLTTVGANGVGYNAFTLPSAARPPVIRKIPAPLGNASYSGYLNFATSGVVSLIVENVNNWSPSLRIHLSHIPPIPLT